MPYLGNNLQVAFPTYRVIDDISSGFNGVTKSFALKVSGATPVPFPINPQQCLISVNNALQKPDSTGTTGFTLTGTNIVFATAPTGGQTFWGVVLAGADYVNAGGAYPVGSATVPSITFQGNTQTGLYLPSANVLGFTTSGVLAGVFDASGNLGVNTQSPGAKVDVVGTIRGSSTITGAAGTAATPTFVFTGSTTTGLYAYGTNQLGFATNGVLAGSIDASGNWGIGIAGSASYKLNVSGTISGTTITASSSHVSPAGTAASPTYVFTGSLTTGFYAAGTNILGFSTAGTSAGVIDASGNWGIGNNAPGVRLDVTGTVRTSGIFQASNGTAAAPTHSFTNNTTIGLYSVSTNVLGFATSGTQAGVIDASGNWGIGKGTAATKLDVAGTITSSTAVRLSGSTSGYVELAAPATAGNNTLKLPTSNGSVGQLLGGDGSGNLSWVTGQTVYAASVATTSGQSVDFSIPSWARCIIVQISGLLISGANGAGIRLGTSGGIVSTGYTGAYGYFKSSSTNVISGTDGFGTVTPASGTGLYMQFIITNLGGSGNTWTATGSGVSGGGGTPDGQTSGGSITLASALTTVRLFARSTDTFTAGSVALFYQG